MKTLLKDDPDGLGITYPYHSIRLPKEEAQKLKGLIPIIYGINNTQIFEVKSSGEAIVFVVFLTKEQYASLKMGTLKL